MPFEAAELAGGVDGDVDDVCVVEDATVGGEGFVEVVGVVDVECDDEVDVIVALAELEVFFADGGAIWRDEDFYEVAVDFVAEVVGFVFIESDNEVTEGVDRFFEGTVWFEELDGVWDVAGDDRGGVFVHFVEEKCEGEGGAKLVDGRVVIKRDQDIAGGFDLFDDFDFIAWCFNVGHFDPIFVFMIDYSEL